MMMKRKKPGFGSIDPDTLLVDMESEEEKVEEQDPAYKLFNQLQSGLEKLKSMYGFEDEDAEDEAY